MHGAYDVICTHTARAHLSRDASTDCGEAGGDSSGRGSAPMAAGDRAAAVGDEGRDYRATCEGRREPRSARDPEVAGREGR